MYSNYKWKLNHLKGGGGKEEKEKGEGNQWTVNYFLEMFLTGFFYHIPVWLT